MASCSSGRNEKVHLETLVRKVYFVAFCTSLHCGLFFFFGYFLHRFGEEMRPVKLTTKVFGTLYVPYPFKISRSIYSPNLQKNNSIGPGLIRNPKGTKHKITIGGWEWQ